MRTRGGGTALALAAGLAVIAGCAGGTSSTGSAAPGRPAESVRLPAALAVLEGSRHALGSDTFEVFVCHVPDDTSDPVFVAGGDRATFTADDLAQRLEATVPAFFVDLSDDRYRPEFVPGGIVDIVGTTDVADHQRCIDEALDASDERADAVFVVADAEHAADRPGGWAQPGAGCECPAATSRRMVYIGASDFHPDWGAVPAVDLAEHEIGHSLGLPHSVDEGTSSDDGHVYTSALDVMSNSAAPRDVDPDRRDGPATIAANLIALGWLDPADIAIVQPGGGVVDLRPSAASDGTRVAVVALDERRLLTVELLTPTGYDAHLPEAGVAVHLVDQSTSACDHTDGTPCSGIQRRQVVLGSPPPHTDLLVAGESLTVEQWTIEVRSLGTSAVSVALRPATGG